MKIKIKDMIPTDDGKVRMYYTIDDSDITTLLLGYNDLNNIQTVENAVKEQLRGKEFIGQSFEI